MNKKVVVIGAGLTGLTTAWKLTGNNIEVEVIEIDSKVGGLAKSYQHNNYVFDYGPHAFHMKNRLVFSELKKLLKSDLLCIGKKKTKVIFRGKGFSDPLRNTFAVLKLGPTMLARCFISYFYAKFRYYSGLTQDNSFEDWLANRFGREFYNIFFGSYTRKVWNMDPKELDANFASERIAPIRISKVLKRIFFREKEPDVEVDPEELDSTVMYYPRKGIHQVCEQMAEEIEKRSGKIHLNTKVTAIRKTDGKIQGITVMSNDQEREIQCDYLVSTIPLTTLMQLMHTDDHDIKESLQKIHFRGASFMFLVVKKSNVFDNHWLYFQDDDIIFYRANQNTMFSPELMPEGYSGLILEMNDKYFSKPGDEVFDEVVRDLEKSNILKKEDIVDYYFDKMDYAYPVYLNNINASLKTIWDYLKKYENLISIGRQGMFRYLDMHHCILMGIIISNQIMSDKLDYAEVENIFAKGGPEGV